MWAIAQCFPQLAEIIRQNYFHAAHGEQCSDGDVMNMIVNVTSADLDRYRKIIAGIEGMDDTQKEEAIHVVYNMMQSFVDAAWGTHPVQLAVQEIEQNPSRNTCEYGSVLPLNEANETRPLEASADTTEPDEEPAP